MSLCGISSISEWPSDLDIAVVKRLFSEGFSGLLLDNYLRVELNVLSIAMVRITRYSLSKFFNARIQ